MGLDKRVNKDAGTGSDDSRKERVKKTKTYKLYLVDTRLRDFTSDYKRVFLVAVPSDDDAMCASMVMMNRYVSRRTKFAKTLDHTDDENRRKLIRPMIL